ncbi:MAG TPA: hypothetical protein VEO01_25365 [Pseudonocardiaceae bacterium]|nr:hypothetical protein [Pseudonocardiaceae bacterium]
MKALLKWLVANADAVIALVIAVFAAVAGLGGFVSGTVVNSAVLVTLAALALSILRDHWRQESTEPEIKNMLARAASALQAVPSQLDSLNDLRHVVTGARQAVEESSMIRVLIGPEISSALQSARRRANLWVFKGGTATFLRAVTLPECVNFARQDRRSLNFQIEILDPLEPGLCERYASYFRSVVDGPNEDERAWTPVGTQHELYATILASCWWQQRYRLLKINIGLSKTMTTFRWDLTSESLIITERGPRFPAMLIESGRFYYDYWRSELDVSFTQARRVEIDLAPLLSELPTVAEVRDLFSAVGVDVPENYTDKDIQEIIGKAIDAENPYE